MPISTPEIDIYADYPTIEPSLRLDFANSRALDPRITFTRASVATYVGKDGFIKNCLLYTSPSPRDVEESRMPSSA